MTQYHHISRRLLVVLAAIGFVAMMLHGWSLAHLLGEGERLGVDFHLGADSGSYIGSSQNLFNDRPLAPVFRERILYPLLLAASNALTGSYEPSMWFMVVMMIPATMAMGLLGYWVSGRFIGAVAASVLMTVHPTMYLTTGRLMPDAMHTQMILMTIAAGCGYRVTGRRGWLMAFMLLLPATQLVRPTLFVIAPLLLVLFWRTPIFSIKANRLALALAAWSMMIPLIFSGLNYRDYGFFKPTIVETETLHRNIATRIRALQRLKDEGGRLSVIYEEERDVIATADPTWQRLGLYGAASIPTNYHADATTLNERNRAFIGQHLDLLVESCWRELVFQFGRAPSLNERQDYPNLYPDDPMLALRLQKAFFYLAAMGVGMALIRNKWNYTLFAIGLASAVTLSLMLYWWESARVRLPVDLLMIPLVSLAITQPVAWLALIFSGLWMGAGKIVGWSGVVKFTGPLLGFIGVLGFDFMRMKPRWLDKRHYLRR